jgi:TPP-dependent trihydroxycyclohexane-1,2-dione (THcHDO) dehydratase
MAFFMLETSRLHVRGGVMPSSKNDLGIVAAVGRLKAALVKEVADAIIGVGMTDPFVNASPRVFVTGDGPFIESVDAAGETPSLT